MSSLSATLMAVFFILLGVTVGIYAGSFLLGKKAGISVVVPAVLSSLMTLIMYVGEMILLNGNLYRFGNGFFFEEISPLVLAPVDIIVIIISGCVTALIFRLLNGKNKQ